MKTKIATFLFFLATAIFLTGTVLWADTESPGPAKTASSGKLEVGPKPTGRIAFISDGDVWIMDADGKNRQMVCNIDNARGRMSFSPDNKKIAFTREGKEASNLPSGEGGAHLLHDIFLAFVDSASTNTGWWNRVTFTLGAYQPEWSGDGTKIYFQNDINANTVDYIIPSHQIAFVEAEGGHSDYLRRDWQTLNTSQLMPSITRDGKKVAFAVQYSAQEGKYIMQNFGIKVVDMTDIMMPEKELRQPSKGLSGTTAPSWSPDGQWLAFLSNDVRNPGIFIIKSDLSDKRLVYSPPVSQPISPYPVSWAPDSKWFTFAGSDGVIYTIDINGENLTPLTGPGAHTCPAWSK